jgi:hypothetical protein
MGKSTIDGHFLIATPAWCRSVSNVTAERLPQELAKTGGKVGVLLAENGENMWERQTAMTRMTVL